MRLIGTGLLIALIGFAAGQKRASIAVSAVVKPAVKLDVTSPRSVRIRLILEQHAQALVWAAVDTCDLPQNPKIVPTSGDYIISFSAADTVGRALVCITSTDGALAASAPLIMAQ